MSVERCKFCRKFKTFPDEHWVKISDPAALNLIKAEDVKKVTCPECKPLERAGPLVERVFKIVEDLTS